MPESDDEDDGTVFELLRSGSAVFVVRMAVVALSFLVLVFFSNSITQTSLGIYFFFQATLILVAKVSDFGLNKATEKRISEKTHDADYFATALALKVVTTTVMALGILALEPYVDAYLEGNLAVFLAFGVVVFDFGQLSLHVMKSEGRVVQASLVKLVSQLVWGGVAIGTAVALDAGFLSLVYGLLAQHATVLVLGAARIPTAIGRPSTERLSSLGTYMKFQVVFHGKGFAFNWLDLTIIGILLTKADVAVYEIAWRVAKINVVLAGALSTALFPQVSKWDADGKTDQIRAALPKLMSGSIIVVVPAVCGAALLAGPILGLVFGEQYTSGAVVFVLLLAAMAPNSTQRVLGNILAAMDRPDLAARGIVVAVIVNAALNVVLVWLYGIVGAAVATGTSFLVATIIYRHYLLRMVEFEFPVQLVGAILASSFGMVTVLWGVLEYVSPDSLPRLFAIVGLGAVVYGVILLNTPQVKELVGSRNPLKLFRS